MHRPSNQDIPGSNLAVGMSLSFLLTSFSFSFLLCDLIFIRGCNFVTRVANILVKCLILIRGITVKAYFLVIFCGVLVYVTLP